MYKIKSNRSMHTPRDKSPPIQIWAMECDISCLSIKLPLISIISWDLAFLKGESLLCIASGVSSSAFLLTITIAPSMFVPLSSSFLFFYLLFPMMTCQFFILMFIALTFFDCCFSFSASSWFSWTVDCFCSVSKFLFSNLWYLVVALYLILSAYPLHLPPSF